MSSIELSVRVSLKQASLRESKQAIVDQLAGYKRLGLTHVVLDFRGTPWPRCSTRWTWWRRRSRLARERRTVNRAVISRRPLP